MLRLSHSLLTLFGSAAAGPFSPSQISGLKLWLEADSLSLSNTDPVTTWTDSSGQGNHAAQAVAGAKPTFRTNAINTTLPVVRFDATDDFMDTPNFSLVQPYTVFAVTKYNAAHVGNDTMVDGLTLNTGRVYRESDTSIAMYAGNVGPQITTTPLTFHLYGVVFNGASSELRIDGGTASTGNVGAGVPGGVRLNLAGVANPGGQDMASLLAYQGLVSSGNRLLLESYVRTKYATP